MIGYAMAVLSWLVGLTSMALGTFTLLGQGPVHRWIETVASGMGIIDIMVSIAMHLMAFVLSVLIAQICILAAKLSVAIGV